MKKKDIERRTCSRRQFLLGLGGQMILLPPLLSLMSKQAHAQAVRDSRITRLLLFPKEYGMQPHELNPLAINNRNARTEGLKTYDSRGRGYRVALDDLLASEGSGADISQLIDSSFNDVRDYLNLFTGLDHGEEWSTGHRQGMFGGSIQTDSRRALYGKSIDVIIEQSEAFKSTLVPGRSYPTARIASFQGGGAFCFDRHSSGAGEANGFIGKAFRERMSDEALFKLYFGTGLTVESGRSASERKKMLVDRLLPDYQRYKNHRRITANDRRLLEDFMTGLEEVEKNLVIPDSNRMEVSINDFDFIHSVGSRQMRDWYKDVYSRGYTHDDLFRSYFRIWKLAFQADYARIAVFNNQHSGISGPAGKALHHDVDDTDIPSKQWKYQMGLMADFTRELMKSEDPLNPGTKMIENVGMIYADEHGYRKSHFGRDLPVITMGGFGGRVNAGTYCNFRRDVPSRKGAKEPGIQIKQLMITALESMGIPRSEYMQFGDGQGFGQFPKPVSLSYKGNDYWERVYAAYEIHKETHNDPLPLFTKS